MRHLIPEYFWSAISRRKFSSSVVSCCVNSRLPLDGDPPGKQSPNVDCMFAFHGKFALCEEPGKAACRLFGFAGRLAMLCPDSAESEEFRMVFAASAAQKIERPNFEVDLKSHVLWIGFAGSCVIPEVSDSTHSVLYARDERSATEHSLLSDRGAPLQSSPPGSSTREDSRSAVGVCIHLRISLSGTSNSSIFL